jgi:hypothetical protein
MKLSSVNEEAPIAPIAMKNGGSPGMVMSLIVAEGA